MTRPAVRVQDLLADGPLAPSVVLAAGAALARQVAATVAAGGTVGDLALSNVLLDADNGRFVLGPDISGMHPHPAPELLAGLPPTERSDVHSLGAVLLEMVTGAPVPRGWSARTAADLPASLPKGVRRALFDAVAADPRDRCATLAGLGDRLQRAQDELALGDVSPPPGAAVPEPWLRKPERHEGHFPWHAALLTVPVVVWVAGLVAYLETVGVHD